MTSKKITKIVAREILDSRGWPTVETTVWSGDDHATASVPSGASTGVHEALELRDGQKNRFLGLGVKQACSHVNTKLSKHLKNFPLTSLQAIDQQMISLDATDNKSKLGANAILSVSLASARLMAKLNHQPLYQSLAKEFGYNYSQWRLPTPLLNVINGGVHADSGLDIQEFFLIPLKGSFAVKLEKSRKVIEVLRQSLIKKQLSVGVGDEGGFAPRLGSNKKALQALHKAIYASGFVPGVDFALGVDAASSQFFDTQKQVYSLHADNQHFKPASIYKLYQRWAKQFHLQIVEDGCAEDDFAGWQILTKELGKSLTLVGDDLFVTNPSRIQAGIISGLANAVLIKPNQIGTISETILAVQLAQKFGYKVIVSHRSGETTDDFISDLSVACGAEYIKAGSLSRGERLAKYNRLLHIESELS